MRSFLTILSVLIAGLTMSQTELLNEDFSNGLPSTWTIYDEDGNTPGNDLFVNGWITYQTAFDTCVASTSYYIDENGNEDTLGASQDYLVTPKISLLSFGNLLTWEAKSADGSYPDGYEVYVSTTDSLVSSFTTQIKMVHSEKPYWKSYSINLADYGFANQDVYIAFKNTTTNGYVLLIDNVKVTGDDPANLNQSAQQAISVYPNPVTDVLSVNNTQVDKIEVYAISGELLLSNINSQNINVSHLKNGTYFVKVYVQNTILTEKIIKL